MAERSNKKLAENIGMEGGMAGAVSYASYYAKIPLFSEFKITNSGSEGIENVYVNISGSSALILPQTITIDLLPRESSVSVDVPNVLNPKYLMEIESIQKSLLSVKICVGKTVVQSLETEICALPMNMWSGLSGNVEMLASFVRPKLSDCQKIKAEAGLQLKTWGYFSEWAGYSGSNKNAVRNALASIYSAIKNANIEKTGTEDYSEYVDTGDIGGIMDKKSASPAELALFIASCIESVKLHPVILLGKNRISVGCWLYENCFSTAILDDMDIVSRYITSGINNIAVFDILDAFAHKNASYTTSESHFVSALTSGQFDIVLDVRRARIDGIYPMPLKVKVGRGYELLGDEEISYESRPKELIDSGKFSLERKNSKELNWQRRLLDLSMKNNLLNFKYRGDCLHLISGDTEAFCKRADDMSKFTVLPAMQSTQDAPPFSSKNTDAGLNELISMEMNQGILRSYCEGQELAEKTISMIRKAKSAQEEVGANTLWMAIGFLKWKTDDEKEVKYAPLCLMPVTLKRLKQNITLEIGDEYQPNTTLLEYLYQEFGIDLRGMEGQNMSACEIMAVFRGRTQDKKEWDVLPDVYIAQFTFARYAMWLDVKENMAAYRKNGMIGSLLTNSNKLDNNKLFAITEDDTPPQDVLLPLPSDSSQFEAVAESAKGVSFVLHGPPGTGKSQTITNMIANAMDQGKRVLFVAEKQAAIQVVKKRLSSIGLGDFVLELHSGKADKQEILRSLDNTLSLVSAYDDTAFENTAARIAETRQTLSAPLEALHKKRRIGVSVYDAIIIYLQNKNAPELVDVESTFYDSLTQQKLIDCESMILTAQAAAKECGGVYRSPFDNINITDCSGNIKDGVLCAAEVVLAELKHLKTYLGLFLDRFGQKISTLTLKKLATLISIAEMLKGDSLDTVFDCDEERFHLFYNANIRYDSETKHWYEYFRALPDIGKSYKDVERDLDEYGDNYRSSKVIVGVLKKLQKISKGEIKEKEEVEWLRRACDIEKAKETILSITELSSNFTGFGGGINDRKRDDFLSPLYRLHALNAEAFMDYNADAFNSMCVRSGHYKTLNPLIGGLISAADAFKAACDEFNVAVCADVSKFSDEDVLDYYNAKCTSLIDNIDMLPAWCLYKSTAQKLIDSGLKFMTDAMESGQVAGDQIISSFRKNVYRNFIRTNVPADDTLSAFSGALLDENAQAFSGLLDSFAKLTREKIRHDLISRLPSPNTEGSLSVELMAYQRAIKGNARTFKIRDLFTTIPELMKVVAPCIMMSPSTVSQYLPPDFEMFDMVIFDEASQVPTCEAVPALARAKSAIIVGDPNQMPPTSFFMNMSSDEEYAEFDDMDSVLEDCLTLGIPEKHLTWHYRSKHESLIAFSNIMYYSSKLCTFPSPDALDSKVTLRYIENGVYDRGGRKNNPREADALIEDVIARLKDERHSKQSIGIVTFSTPQQDYIEKKLTKAIYDNKLEAVAYEREEPLFIKNLENVQGDERDVILFSVCYGPDREGKLSLNFGPLNQYGGWRRLNVAVSRAREEMRVYSSMRYSVIDLSRTTSRGVAGLKAFLEFAEKGRTNIAVKNTDMIINRNGIGKYVAQELQNLGYDCRTDVGVSDFKIDVGVLDPSNKHNFILAILCDGTRMFSVKDRTVMQVQTLKRNNWNVFRLYSLNFFNNPKREIKKIKEYLDKLTQDGKSKTMSFKKAYKPCKIESKEADGSYILNAENDAEIMKVIKAVVAAEEPISQQFLIKRTLFFFGITKYGTKVENKVTALIDKCGFASCKMVGHRYYFRQDKYSTFERYRVEEDTQLRSLDTDYTPYDIISLVKSILLNKVSMYLDELIQTAAKEIKIPRVTDKMTSFISACIEEGVSRGIFIKSISDRISLC